MWHPLTGNLPLQEGGQSPEPLAIQPYNRAQQRPGGGETAAAQRAGRTAWRWVQQAGADRAVVPATYRGAPMVLQQGINPNQALLLNSLRRLLQVSPQMEQELKRWCAEPLADSLAAGLRGAAAANASAPDRGAGTDRRLRREAPNLGAQFAQLVKELRSEYFAAITLCAERLAAELAKMPATSVVQLLRRDGVFASTQQLSGAVSRPRWRAVCLLWAVPTAAFKLAWPVGGCPSCSVASGTYNPCPSPASISLTYTAPPCNSCPAALPTYPPPQLMRIMEEVEKLLHWLSNVLDNRVFVALTRGLWDLTSKDVLDYTEDLREGRGGQRVGGRRGEAGGARQCCLERAVGRGLCVCCRSTQHVGR